MSRSVRALLCLIGLVGFAMAGAGARGAASTAQTTPQREMLAEQQRVSNPPTTDLLPPRAGVLAESVHGPDGRVRVLPSVNYHRTIAYLQSTAEDGSEASCTGTVVGAGVVLTAAHCVTGPRGESPVSSILVVPGKDGDSEPWGSQFAASWAWPRGWTELPDPDYNAYDFALVFLPDQQLTARVGTFPGKLTPLADAELLAAGLRPTIAGYAGDCDRSVCAQREFGRDPYGTFQWVASSASFLDADAQSLVSDIDTWNGDSGAAVFRAADLAVVGIHAASSSDYTYDVRLSASVIAAMTTWCAAKSGCSLNVAQTAAPPPATTPIGTPNGQSPVWVNSLSYGSAGGGFYWDFNSSTVWTAERGWHAYSPRFSSPPTLWVNFLTYGSIAGGFYLDPLSGQVWTAERGWHPFSPTGVAPPLPPTPTPTPAPPTPTPTRTATPTPPPSGPKTSFPDGAYAVPSEMPPGTYRNSPSSAGGFCIFYKNGTQVDYGMGQFLVVVDGSWTVFRSTGCGTWSPAISAGPTTTFPDGAYAVPSEVRLGSYRNTPTSSGGLCVIYKNGAQFDYGTGQFLIVIDGTWSVFRSISCGTWSAATSLGPRMSFQDGAYAVPAEVPIGAYRNAPLGAGSICVIYKNGHQFQYGTGQFLIQVDSTWTVFRSDGCGTWSKQ